MTIKNWRGDVVSTKEYKGTSYDAKDCKEWADNTVGIKNKELASSSIGAVASHNL